MGENGQVCEFQLGNQAVKQVEEFKHLGTVVHGNGGTLIPKLITELGMVEQN